jgi:hypothetical protein
LRLLSGAYRDAGPHRKYQQLIKARYWSTTYRAC